MATLKPHKSIIKNKQKANIMSDQPRQLKLIFFVHLESNTEREFVPMIFHCGWDYNKASHMSKGTRHGAISAYTTVYHGFLFCGDMVSRGTKHE